MNYGDVQIIIGSWKIALCAYAQYRIGKNNSPGRLVVSDISLMAIFAEVTENERIIDRHLRGIHPLLDYDASESQSMISI